MINNIAPSYLSVNITPIIESHKYNTRSSSHNLVITSYSSHAGKSFHVAGIKLWNNLEPSLKSSMSISQFKKKVKIIALCQKLSPRKKIVSHFINYLICYTFNILPFDHVTICQGPHHSIRALGCISTY